MDTPDDSGVTKLKANLYNAIITMYIILYFKDFKLNFSLFFWYNYN